MLVVFPVPGGPCQQRSCDHQMGVAVVIPTITHRNDDVGNIALSGEYLNITISM